MPHIHPPPSDQELGLLISPTDSPDIVLQKSRSLQQIHQLAFEQSGLLATLEATYPHWENLRHQKEYSGYPIRIVWAALKLLRRSKYHAIPLRTANQQPFLFITPLSVQAALHQIDKNLGSLLEHLETPGIRHTRQEHVINSLMEEAIASSQIEGAATTRKVAKEMLRAQRPPRSSSEQMILNNYVTVSWLREKRNQPLTPKLIHEIHQRMTRKTLQSEQDAGRLRSDKDRIVVDDPATGEILHVPPPANELSKRLQQLCDFANDTTSSTTHFIHPVIRSILIHFWLAYDHPYVDGNGRTARALFYWSMLKHDYWVFEFLPISRIIRKAPGQYRDAFLKTETDDNDLTYFILYHLGIIAKAKDDFRHYLREQTKVQNRLPNLNLGNNQFNSRQRTILAESLDDPYARRWDVRKYASRFGIGQNTARRDLYELCKKGYLNQFKEGHSFIFEISGKLKTKKR